MKFISGIDVSKKYFDIEISDKVFRFNMDNKDIKKLLKQLPSGSHCILESTGTYGNKLMWDLHSAGHIVYMVNPLQISNFSKMKLSKVKTDKSDAKLITEYGRMNIECLKPYDFPDAGIQSVNQLEAVISQLIKQRTALTNQLEALEQYKDICKEAAVALKKTITYLSAKITELEKKQQDYIDKDNKTLRENISSVIGIGNSTACMLIAVTNGFNNFENFKQVSSYFGCCPRVYQSGSSVKRRGSISKIGMASVRTRLYLCALSAKQYNPKCKELFERLIENGKPFKVAMMAVVNKLIKQVFAIVRKNEKFDKNYNISFGF